MEGRTVLEIQLHTSVCGIPKVCGGKRQSCAITLLASNSIGFDPTPSNACSKYTENYIKEKENDETVKNSLANVNPCTTKAKSSTCTIAYRGRLRPTPVCTNLSSISPPTEMHSFSLAAQINNFLNSQIASERLFSSFFLRGRRKMDF